MMNDVHPQIGNSHAAKLGQALLWWRTDKARRLSGKFSETFSGYRFVVKAHLMMRQKGFLALLGVLFLWLAFHGYVGTDAARKSPETLRCLNSDRL